MYQLPLLADVPGLAHGFSTRSDEGNQGYRFCGEVTRNRAVFLRKVCPITPPLGSFGMTVGMKPLENGHEETIRIVRHKWDAGRGMMGTPGVPCEAMITDDPGLFLFIALADCLPLILYDRRRRVLALIHAGRQSTLLRIPEKTLRMMREKFGTDPTDVVAGIGPGLRSHYLERLPVEVCDDSLWRMHCHRSGRKFLMDLFGYNKDCLVVAGVPEENIEECPYDTYERSDLFFSHRRSSKTGEPEGRHACVVGMLSQVIPT